MTPATFLSLPLAIGIAWAGGNMAARMQTPPAAVADPCAMRFQMAEREAALVIDVPCRIIPTIRADTDIARRHPAKLFYDRVPEEAPMVPVAVRPEFPAKVAEVEAEPEPAKIEPRRTSRGCKPGRTRNAAGRCGVWK